jgi:hypothetical protein
MAENKPEAINLLLSQEELMFVLNLLGSGTIPGMEPEPAVGEFSPEQRQLVLTLAERALRARELVHVQPDGELVVHRLLLSAVVACAFPDRALFVYHWPAGESTPLRYFGHWRGNEIVGHTVPESALHLFTLLPDEDALVEQVLTAAGYRDTNGVASQAFDAPTELFSKAQQLVTGGDTAQAVAEIARHTGNPEAAAALVDTLAGGPEVTIFQLLIPVEGDPTPQRRDVTLLQGKGHSWLVSPTPDSGMVLHIQTARREALLAQLIIDN